MKKGSIAFVSAGLGVGLMYLLDPRLGNRRRAVAKDRSNRFLHQTERALDKTSRDLSHRTQGFISRSKSKLRRNIEISSEILEERIRSKLGRVVSYPHSIEIDVDHGIVNLHGLILSNEIQDLISTIYSVHGVKEIKNHLEVHKAEENLPRLQLPHRQPPGEKFDIFQNNWAPATRLLTGVTGSAMTVYGLKKQDLLGAILGISGLGLFLRTISNMKLARFFGVSKEPTLTIKKIANINAPIERVYDFWSKQERYPEFMDHIKEIKKVNDSLYRWTVDGPGSIPVSWNSRITQMIPNKLISWESEPGSIVQHKGHIRLQKNEQNGTRVDIDFSYHPPVGIIGHLFAKVFRADPKSRFHDSIMRIKSRLEKNEMNSRYIPQVRA